MLGNEGGIEEIAQRIPLEVEKGSRNIVDFHGLLREEGGRYSKYSKSEDGPMRNSEGGGGSRVSERRGDWGIRWRRKSGRRFKDIRKQAVSERGVEEVIHFAGK